MSFTRIEDVIWEAPDGSRWSYTASWEEWSGTVPGIDRIFECTIEQFRAEYPDAPDWDENEKIAPRGEIEMPENEPFSPESGKRPIVRIPYKWAFWHPWTWLLSKVGHWEWEHEFKTCPTGERHCPHMHYKIGRN